MNKRLFSVEKTDESSEKILGERVKLFFFSAFNLLSGGSCEQNRRLLNQVISSKHFAVIFRFACGATG